MGEPTLCGLAVAYRRFHLFYLVPQLFGYDRLMRVFDYDPIFFRPSLPLMVLVGNSSGSELR